MGNVIRIEEGNYPKNLSKAEGKFPYVFHLSYLLYLNREGYQSFFFLYEDEVYLPFVLKKSKIIWTAYYLYPPISNGGRLDTEKEEQCFNSFFQALNEMPKADRVLPFIPLDVSYAYPKNVSAAVFGNVSLNLQELGQEELFSNFKSSNRNIIRKAIKEKAYVKFGDEVFQDFYSVYKGTLDRQNLYYDSMETIKNLYSALYGKCLCAVVYNSSDEPEGTLLVPFTQYAGYSLYAGSVSSPKVRGAVKYLHWEMIIKLKNLGVNKFIFGGVRVNKNADKKYVGLKDFKMSFGGVLNEGYLWKKNLNSTKVGLFENLLKTKMLLSKQSYSKDIIEQINEEK